MASVDHNITNGGGRRSLVKRLIDANTSGARATINGLIPYLTADGVSILEPELQALARAEAMRTMSIAEGHLNEALVTPIVIGIRDRLALALEEEYCKEIPGTSLSLAKIRKAYKAVIEDLLDKYARTVDGVHAPVKLPANVLDMIRTGELFATEDFRDFIKTNRVSFISEVARLSPDDIGNNPFIPQEFEKHAIQAFQRIFDDANEALLEKLGLRLTGETNDALSDRIDRHQVEAVAFLEQVHKAAEQFQLQQLRAWQDSNPNTREPQPPPILTALKPKDITFKRFSDLAELLFYPNKYPIGAQRRFVAQQILVLTLLYEYIERYPPFKMKIESARRLHNDLNLALDGRAGRLVSGVYIDRDGNKSLAQDDRFCVPYNGVREFNLLPRVIATPRGAITLFTEGQWVGIESRCKTPSSTLLKLLNKGNITEITDLVGFDFVIDDRGMDTATLCRTILQLKAYIKSVWGVSEFVEDYTGITNPGAVSNNNASTSPQFVNEKVVFFHNVKGINVPVEIQFKTLRMKFEAENKSGAASHERYRLDQAVKRNAFGELFPEAVFGGFASIAAQVEPSVQNKMAEEEVAETRV